MNEADDEVTIKREAASAVLIDGSALTTGLSPEDEAVVKRWRAEVGDERLQRIAVALAAGRPGRKSEEPDRMHLLLMMARFSRANPNAAPNRLACMVVASPEGKAECVRSYATPDALNRWLRDKWKKHSTKLKRTIAATEQHASSINQRGSLETVLQFLGNLKRESARLPKFEEAAHQSFLPPGLQSLLSSREVAAIENWLTGPLPPGAQVFLASPEFRVLKAALAPKEKFGEAVRSLLPPPLENTPDD